MLATSSLRIVAPTRIGSAAYAAGLDMDDEITKIGDESVSKVEDVDAAYKRALECGATSLAEPEDKPYDERSAGVQDTFGNTPMW